MNNTKYKSARNNNLKIKKIVKITNKRTVEINEDSLIQALSDLESGNYIAVKNFLRSLEGKKYKNSKKTREVLEEYSKELKRNATPAEKELKKILKESKVKFVFQKPVTCKKGVSYIMDFYLPFQKVCIEVDGGYHNIPEQLEKDLIRTKNLNALNIVVFRITNEEVFDTTKVKSFVEEIVSGGDN